MHFDRGIRADVRFDDGTLLTLSFGPLLLLLLSTCCWCLRLISVVVGEDCDRVMHTMIAICVDVMYRQSRDDEVG